MKNAKLKIFSLITSFLMSYTSLYEWNFLNEGDSHPSGAAHSAPQNRRCWQLTRGGHGPCMRRRGALGSEHVHECELTEGAHPGAVAWTNPLLKCSHPQSWTACVFRMLGCWFEAATSQMRNSDSAESQPWLGPQLTVKATPLTVFLKAHESVLLGTAASVATPTAPDMDKTELVVPEGSTRATRSRFQVWLETLPSHSSSSGLRVGTGSWQAYVKVTCPTASGSEDTQ